MRFLLVLLLSAIGYNDGQVVLTSCENPVVYSPCDLTCTTPDQSSTAVKFVKPPDLFTVIGQCLSNGFCTTTAAYTISRTTSRTTVLTVLNYTCVESVMWRCDYNSDHDTYDLPCVEFPVTATTTDISDNAVVNSSIVITVNLGCLVSQGTVEVKLDYKDSGGTIVDSSSLAPCSNVSLCADPLYSSYECQVNLLKESSVQCETKYSIEANVKVADAERTESIHLLSDVEFTCKVSKEVDDKTYDFIQYNGFVNLGGSGVSGGGCAQVLIHGTLTITAKKAGLLFFSNQYFIGGTVVYGIQIVFVSTAMNTITIISGVVLLAIYFGKVQSIAILYFILLAAAASMLSVLIFMAIVYLFGHKEFIHIKFKNRKKSKNMSSLGLKLTKNDTINFSFKVKAINACMTLHVLENGETESISKSRKVKMVLGDGFPENRVPNSRDSLICNIVSHTEYTSFCLNTENKHITLLNEQGGIILQWTCSAESFTVKDIEISNINQDDSTKDSSTEKEKEEKLDTPDEWIFWFRKGDTLCEIGEHEREIKEGLRCKQTVQLICVVIFPIAWLVMIVLMVKYLFKSKGKKADDNESEMSEQLNKKQKESSEQQNKKQKG